MKLIDADKLFEDLKKEDLEFMQQADLMICIKDIIDRQTVISKNININRITTFDNRKSNK